MARTSPIILAAALLASPSIGQQRPSWTGSDIAATARPLTVVDLSREASRSGRTDPPTVRRPGRPWGYRPPRSIHVDPYGNVTTFVGTPPPFLGGQYYEPRGALPIERTPVAPRPLPDPCASGAGPATAASAIAGAVSATGRRC